jgi:sulfonate transport system substrate-binding protein
VASLHQYKSPSTGSPWIELWYARPPVPTVSGIAWHFRWLQSELARHGLALQSIRASDDPDRRMSHLKHQERGQFREGGNIPAIWSRGEGAHTAVVGITWIDEAQFVLVRRDSEIRDMTDLRGRRIGLPKRETSIVDVGRAQDLHGFVTALALVGLKTLDVEMVDVPTMDYDLREDFVLEHTSAPLVEALVGGKVDAIFAKGASGVLWIQKYGLRPIVDINRNPDPLVRINNGTPRPITVDRELALTRPELVAHYLAVLLRTAVWARSHQLEVIKAVAAEIGTTRENVKIAYGPELHCHFDIHLSPDYIAALEIQKDFLRDWGFSKDFDYRAWIVPGPLVLAEKLVATEELDAPALLAGFSPGGLE